MTVISEERRPPGAVGRTERFVLTLSGVLPLVYEQAWQSVLDGGPRRAVRADGRFPLRVVDWRATRPEVQDVRLAELLAREAAVGFPPDGAPPMRATLARRDDRTWTFAWRYARELMDRRAGLRLLEGATEAYAALLRGDVPRCADGRAGGDGRAGAGGRLVGPVGR